MWIHILTFAAGLGALYLGADWLVRGAARLAGTLGVSPLLVGLTIVAFGNSAPELVVGVLASAYGQGQLTVGNVIGSNIFNLLFVMGIVVVIGSMKVGELAVRIDLWVMLGVSIGIWPLLRTGHVLNRKEGALLLVVYLVYIVSLFLR